MGQTKFVRRSLKALSEELAGDGFAACPTTVARLLRSQNYSPRINVKRFTGPKHPDRDQQFANIQEWVEIFAEAGQPIISVDGKKKELIGNFKNAGAVWRHKPEEVNVYDFVADAECRATPYGIFDLLSGGGISASTRRRIPPRLPLRRSARGGHGTAASAIQERTSC